MGDCFVLFKLYKKNMIIGKRYEKRHNIYTLRIKNINNKITESKEKAWTN